MYPCFADGNVDEVPSLDVSGPIGAWLVTALLSASPEAEVQRPSEGVALVLDWQAPASCPVREALIAELRTLLPALPEEIPEQGTARLRIEARVELADAGPMPWTVELTTITAEGTRARSFSARHCEDAAAAAVLIIAVTLDPVEVASGLREASAATELDETEPELEQPEPLEPDPTELPSKPRSTSGDAGTLVLSDDPPKLPGRAPRVGLRLFGTGAYGPTNTGYGGVGGSVALFDRRWRWDLAAGWSIPRVVRFEDGRGGSFDGWWIGSHGCFVPEARDVEFPSCAGFEAGLVRGRGRSPTANTDQASLPWFAAAIGQGIAWAPIDRLAIGVDLTLLVPISRGSFVIDEREVQRLSLVGARALLGIELRLP